MTVKVKKLRETATLPTRGSNHAAGYDLYADINDTISINPREVVKVGTGLSMELEEGTFGAIFARSGLATKQGLRPANCTGIIDEDYRGEYIVALYNDSNCIQYIKPGDRIAQLIIMRYNQVTFVEAEELSDTARGDGGFGSTGLN